MASFPPAPPKAATSDPSSASAKQVFPSSAPVLPSCSVSFEPGKTRSVSLDQRELQQQRALDHRKIIVGDHGQHGVAFGRDMGVDAFHVVDLVAEIGFEDRWAVDGGA